MSESHAPDLEDLAAFVDGRLSGERKARVEEHLLRDEDYYEVFLETVRFREQERDEERAPAPIPIARWRSWRVAAPLAAAATLAIAVGVLRPSADLAGYLDAPAVAAWGEGWDDSGWSRTRSGGGGSRYSSEQLAFRLGARTVDLRVALAAGDGSAARRLAAQAEDWCQDTDLFSLASLYQRLGEQLEDGEPEASLLDPARDVEKLLAESFDGSEAERFAVGRWAEAGRLAALSGDAGALDRIVRRDPGARSIDEIADEIEALDDVLERSDPGAQDLDEAAAAFRGIIARLAG